MGKLAGKCRIIGGREGATDGIRIFQRGEFRNLRKRWAFNGPTLIGSESNGDSTRPKR